MKQEQYAAVLEDLAEANRKIEEQQKEIDQLKGVVMNLLSKEFEHVKVFKPSKKGQMTNDSLLLREPILQGAWVRHSKTVQYTALSNRFRLTYCRGTGMRLSPDE